MYLVQTVQTSTAWRPPMPLPNEGKTNNNVESLERRPAAQIGQITSVPQQQQTSNSYKMGGNGGVFESQYAITPDKKDIIMTTNATPVTGSGGGATKDKKWSIGGFFRRNKKKAAGYDSTSDEDYAENGGVSRRSHGGKDAKKSAGSKRTSKVGGFDHIVQVPTDVAYIHSGGVQRKSTGSLDRVKNPSLQHFNPTTANNVVVQQHRNNSSDDELLLGIRSCNSSNISRFRSDDSLMTNQSTPSNRKSRAARTERYLKRRSRDGEGPNPLVVGGPYYEHQSHDPRQQHLHVSENRWKTQPIMFHGSNQSMTPSSTYSSNYQQQQHQQQQHQQQQQYQNHYPQQQQQHQQQPHNPYGLQNSTSLSQMPQIINFQMNYTTPPQPQATHSSRIHPENRSFSYDNYINRFSLPKSNHQTVQYANQQQIASPPPPPPPRDPMRRLTVDTAQSVARPISYAFDKYNQAEGKGRHLGQRCVSDDHLWSQNGLMVPNQPPQHLHHSPNYYSNVSMRSKDESPMQSRKSLGITAGPQISDPSKPGAFKYVADATPRSRKPIHVMEDMQQISMKNYQAQRNKSRSATDFWKKIDQQVQLGPKEQSDALLQPRTIKSKAVLTPQRSLDTDMLKSNSLSRSYRFDVPVPQSCDQILNDAIIPDDACRFKPVNKYEEHIAKNMAVNNLRSPNMVGAQQKKKQQQNSTSSFSAPSSHAKPDKSQWSAGSRDVVDFAKSKNLEDAINELEAIYKSLKLSDEELLDRADRRDIPSPTGFSAKVKEYQYDDDEEDEDGMRRQPDIVLDDVVYRNLKHANKFPKVTDSQPPFGIPVGPIPPPAAQDYLKVTPISSNASTSSMSPVGDRVRTAQRDSPDLVTDDLAVRNLRKDNGQAQKANHFVQPTNSGSGKKKPVRSQSANIYNLIHRDATRPSGGCLDDYNVFDELSKKLINLTDADSDATDVPITVFALRKKEGVAKPRETRYKTISSFLHPNNTNGAVFNLPSTLQQKPPIPTPRKSISPYLTDDAVPTSPASDCKGIDMLNKLVMDAKISSEKLSKDLDDLRKDGKFAAKEEKLRVTSQSPLAKRIDVLEITKPTSGSPQATNTEKQAIKLSSPIISSPDIKEKLKTFSPKVIESEETSKLVKEEVVLPVEKVNDLVEKFNERIKDESRESSPITAPKKSSGSSTPSKKSKSLTNKIKLLEDINDASKAVRACEKMLVDVVQDTPQSMLNDKKFLDDINEVSLAVRGCEKILKGVVPMDGSDVDDRSTDKSTPDRQSVVLDCEIPVSVRALKEAYEKETKSPPKVSSPIKEKETRSPPKVSSPVTEKETKSPTKVSSPVKQKETKISSKVSCPVIEKETKRPSKVSSPVKVKEAKSSPKAFSPVKEKKSPAKVSSPVKEKLTSPVVKSKPIEDQGDYDNLQEKSVTELVTPRKRDSIPESEKIVLKPIECKPEIQREIDEMMKACTEEEEKRSKSRDKSLSSEKLLETPKSLSVEKSPPYSTPCEDLSSPVKSSSVTPNNNFPKSSSLTSFNAFSSSDYLKSPSSERGIMSNFEHCVKSNSTTSYDVKSTTASLNSDETLSPVESKPNLEEALLAPPEVFTAANPSVKGSSVVAAVATTFAAVAAEKPIDQSPAVALTEQQQHKKPERLPRAGGVAPPGIAPPGIAEFTADPTDSSQYNSSEELAMIFGIRQPSVTPPTGNQVISFSEWSELESAVDEEDEIDLDRNNNSLSAINNNSFTATSTTTPPGTSNPDMAMSSSPKSAPKQHGLRYFGTKRNELEIIFENPHENGCTYEDPDTEDLLAGRKGGQISRHEDVEEVDNLDLKFTTEMVIKRDMSVDLDASSGKVRAGNDDGGDNDKRYTNELEINVVGGGDSGHGTGAESETDTFRGDAVVGELDDDDVDDKQDLNEEEECAEEKACETSCDERGSDLESSPSAASVNKSETAGIANKLNLPLTCNDQQPKASSSSSSSSEAGERSTSNGPVMRRGVGNRQQHTSDVANGKERPNLLHPEHFLFASLAYQGLSSYDDILTVLAILIALITLIALIFI